jgi:site-specific DNA-cytosine methylase
MWGVPDTHCYKDVWDSCKEWKEGDEATMSQKLSMLRIDVVIGGFLCQGVSAIGPRTGLVSEERKH